MSLASVIITMYNAEAFISATLESLLQEHEVPLEVVLINNGCTDASVERARAVADERVRLLDGPGQGVASALNQAIEAAQGEIIMRCDADDLFSAERIKRQVRWLTEHPEFGAVCGNYATIDPKGRLITNFQCGKESEEVTEELRNGTTRTHLGTFAIRTEVLRPLGGFREYFRLSEDIDLQLRIGDVCRVWFLPEIEYYYRLHDQSITHSRRRKDIDFYDSMAHEFQRQRHQQGKDSVDLGCPPEPPPCTDESVVTSTEHSQGLLLGSAWVEHQAGRKRQALAMGWRSVMIQPRNAEVWRSLLALAVKPAGKG